MGEKAIGAVESRFSGILGAAVVGTALYFTLKPAVTEGLKDRKTNEREGVPSAGVQSNVEGWVEPPPPTGIWDVWSAKMNSWVKEYTTPAPPPAPIRLKKDKYVPPHLMDPPLATTTNGPLPTLL